MKKNLLHSVLLAAALIFALTACSVQLEPSNALSAEQTETFQPDNKNDGTGQSENTTEQHSDPIPISEREDRVPSDDESAVVDDEIDPTLIPPEPDPEPEPEPEPGPEPEPEPDPSPVVKNWTFLVYMAADNNLEKSAIADFNELESTDLSESNISLLVLFDRCAGYDATNGNWTDTRLFNVTYDEEKSNTIVSERIACPDLGLSLDSATELDMADKSTLSAFLTFAAREYPAEHYGLIMWGHGTGWRGENVAESITSGTRAYAIDSYADTYMTIAELREGIQSGLAGMEGTDKLDFIGFDTCFGVCMETAFELKDCAAYLAGTPALVPANGWQYDNLFSAFAASDQSVSALCDCALDQYKRQYASYGYASFSVVDSAHVSQAVDAFNQCAAACAATITDLSTKTTWRALMQNALESYHLDSYPCDYFVDVYSFAEAARDYDSSLSTSADTLISALRAAISCSWNATQTGSPFPMSVFYAVFVGEDIPQVSHPAAYINGSRDAGQSQFVRQCTGYVPTTSRSGSLLDKLFRMDLF